MKIIKKDNGIVIKKNHNVFELSLDEMEQIAGEYEYARCRQDVMKEIKEKGYEVDPEDIENIIEDYSCCFEENIVEKEIALEEAFENYGII